MRSHLRTSCFAALLTTAFGLFACSSDTGTNDEEGLPSGNGARAGAASAGMGGSDSTGAGGSGAQSSAGGKGLGTGGTIPVNVAGTNGNGEAGASTGNGTPEECDGEDNDENGIIDDVDAGGDGVCDCLNIATIGRIGPWSDGGNIFADWLNARSPQGAVELGDQELTSELLAPFQVIVVLHAATLEIDGNGELVPAHHAFSDDEVTAFSEWIENGGGVMTTIGYTYDEASEVENVNRLLEPIGAGYSSTRLDLTDFVTSWEEHPVTMGVSSIFTDNGVEPEGDGTVVAYGSGDRVALQVVEAENGKAVVWGDEWITYDSEWVDVEGQQVELFWLNILKWLSPEKTCQVPIPPEVVR
jgi:hypothetical protein